MQSKDPDLKGQCKRINMDFILGFGVIGNTEDFGPSVMGSSPVSPTKFRKKLNFFEIIFEKYTTNFYIEIVIRK